MDDKNQPLVSVVIPLYNQERYFDACIRSVCNQTYKNLEIIVINDGSTDGSHEIACKWAALDHRIKYISKKNEGLVTARFDAFRLSKGEYITPLDSDDCLPKNAIAILANYMQGKNVDVVLGEMFRMIGPVKKKHWLNRSDAFPYHRVVEQPELYDNYYLSFFGGASFPIMMCGKLYRKSIIYQAMRETKLCSSDFPFVGEDHFFNMMLFPYIRSMYRTDETVYYYRYGGASSSRFSPTYPALLLLSDIRLNLLDSQRLNGGYKSLFNEYVDIVFYHGQQLLEFKKGEKADVINFFKEELSTREIARRMDDFYDSTNDMSERIQLVLNRDYEGMYDSIVRGLKVRNHSLKYRCRQILLKMLDVFEWAN